MGYARTSLVREEVAEKKRGRAEKRKDKETESSSRGGEARGKRRTEKRRCKERKSGERKGETKTERWHERSDMKEKSEKGVEESER